MATIKATKIKLGNPPKSIAAKLEFLLLDGTMGVIGVNFKYRTRSEFAAFCDEFMESIKAEIDVGITEAKAAVEAAEAEPVASQFLSLPSEKDINEKKTARQVDFVLGALDGWDLDVPLEREFVEQLADQVPQAITEIMGKYRTAMTEGRLGN